LLTALAGDGRDLTVVGDPDQAIYAFRGADVRGILEFPDRFGARSASGAIVPAPVVALSTSRRSGQTLVDVARRISARLPVPQGFSHRELAASAAPGEITVATLATEGAEAEWIADRLRREHLDRGVPWSAMAVLVRSGASVPLLRRSLGAMGVPVEVAADELPLAAEPAVAPLLLALRCAAEPFRLTDEWVRELLLSPLIGADPAELRRVGRGLRQAERAKNPDELPPAAQTLIRQAVADPSLLDVLPPQEGTGIRRLGVTLARASALLRDGGTPADALWSLWSDSRWRLRLFELAGRRDAEARAADRDLDAVVALFDTVTRTQQQRVGIRVSALLETLAAQQIPAGTQEERAVPREGVRLLTAHRSKGLEWDVVVVAHVQETSWPDLRARGSLLNPDELGPDGAQLPLDARAVLADERRLFYVACTRARRLLIVTAVASVAEDGERPSRFLGELGVPVLEQAPRPGRPRTLAGLVAALRCEAVDPARSAEVRAAAARRLAILGQAQDQEGRPLVPAADPQRWWGMLPRTVGEPYDPSRPTPLSASTLNKLADCPLAWFLAHEARAESPATVALGFGKVVHALADLVSRGVLPADEDVLLAELDRVWGALGYEVPWQRTNEREQARRAIRRLLTQLAEERGRTFVLSEAAFDAEVSTPDGPVTLRGRVDRVEQDAEGRYVVVDYKTGRTKLATKKLPEDRQLALYQYVVQAGAIPGLPPGAHPGGAELWQLRVGDDAGATVQAQDPPEGGFAPLVDELGAARRRVLAEDFSATPSETCKRCAFRGSCPGSDEGRGVVE
jgi:superfamily I DNA/RNA helicase/RecB family exonuclease